MHFEQLEMFTYEDIKIYWPRIKFFFVPFGKIQVLEPDKGNTMFIFAFTFIVLSNSFAQQPHIIFIFVDDLGWNDVGYHGSEIMVSTIF